MSDLVSIIVPVYNAEKHLSECIKSILEQSYVNFELILVNDGSSDASGEICDSFAKTDSRITVLHIENQGVANARNVGIDMANGKYLAFADSDDIVEKSFIKTAYNIIESEKSDYVTGAFTKLENGKLTSSIDYLADKTSPIAVEDYLERMSEYQAGAFWGANWAKLFKKNIVADNCIKFEKNVLFAEDLRFNLEYLKYTNKISLIHTPVYFYRIDTLLSLSKKKRDSYIFWEEYHELYNRYKNLYACKNLTKKCLKQLHQFALNMAQEIIRADIRQSEAGLFKTIKLVDLIFSDKDFCEAYTNVTPLYKYAFLLKMYLLELRLTLKKRSNNKGV